MQISEVIYFLKTSRHQECDNQCLHLHKCMYWLQFQFQNGHIKKFVVVVQGMGKWVWSQVPKVSSDYSQSLMLKYCELLEILSFLYISDVSGSIMLI